MLQEDTELLLKDLCARLPYRVKVLYLHSNIEMIINSILPDKDFPKFSLIWNSHHGYWNMCHSCIDEFEPYLRPMYSMTESEKHELLKFGAITRLENGEVIDVSCVGFERHADVQDWLNAHHFDYHGLIEKGLALEAPEGMY